MMDDLRDLYQEVILDPGKSPREFPASRGLQPHGRGR